MHRSGSDSTALGQPRGSPAATAPGAHLRRASNKDPSNEAYLWMGRAMRRSIFCLVPPGDTCVTSRLYTAIAAGCIPVVLCDRLVGGFAANANYSSFWVSVS